jgi:DNA-binding Lrp family transcriptional regulator
MKVKLDLKDRKILYQLDINSGQTNSEIAKKVGLSKQVVGFRINRLCKEKVISSFYSVIDISKLGFTVHKIFLRLQNTDGRKEKEIIDFLVNHPDIVWVASADARFDLAFGTWAKDMAFLDKTLTELNRRFGEYIAEEKIATIIRGDYFTRDYLVNKKEPRSYRETFFGAIPNPVKMDKIDWEILLLLGKNSRSTVTEISKKIKLSTDAVAGRIKKLEKSGVIKHYNFIPNEAKYPYLHYKILVNFRNISEDREKMLREYCRINPNIVYIVKALGPWSFEIDFEVETIEKFRELLMDIKMEFSDLLKEYFLTQIYQVHKYNFCPSIQI